MWTVPQSWYIAPWKFPAFFRSWVEPSTTTWGTKIQGPGVAFVFLGKGISAQHPTNTRDDATKHRSQQKPPETNEWIFQAATVQVTCHPLRSHTHDILHDLIFRKCLVKQQPGPISHRASDQCRSTRSNKSKLGIPSHPKVMFQEFQFVKISRSD